MGTSGKFRRTRQGFTLVELLVVIVIIGILAGLITAAAINARNTVKITAVLTEIGQIDIALERYKSEFGEYPPDFAFTDGTHASADTAAARARVIRHLRKRFPKYRPIGDTLTPANTPTDWLRFCFDVENKVVQLPAPGIVVNYGVNPATFDAASGLVFWLGGLPDTAPADPWIPRGFHSDPKFPFKQGLPRTDSFYEFDPERLIVIDATDPTKQLRYIPRYIEIAPLVYFKAIKSAASGEYEYGDVGAGANFLLLSFEDTSSPDPSFCVPYLKKVITTPGVRSWESPEKYQIICAGMDSLFGDSPVSAVMSATPGYRVTSTGLNFSLDGGDYDNLTSFSTVKLEDGIE